MEHTATYSPEDDKLRLYPACRLDAETYGRVKAAGFKWAPKQELFVAPTWTPDREDLLTELCGEIGDEDTSLVDRAEERADRFEDYSDQRERDADRAKAAVDAIADGIPMGQPILVGHHSEKRARRDAEKIENGMRKAVHLWRTSQYWADRAKGAIRHAKYKERPDVRARRIKGIEADKRKAERSRAEALACLKLWESCRNLDQARLIAGRTMAGYLPVVKHPELNQYLNPSDVLPFADRDEYKRDHYPTVDLDGVKARAREVYPATAARHDRWIEHYENRLAYERAMLADAGGIAADRTGPEKGGACRCWCSPGYGRGWSFVKKVNKVSVTVEDNWGNDGKNFTRTIPFDKLSAVMTAAEVQTARAEGRLHETANALGFYLDSPAESRAEARERVHAEATVDPKAAEFDALAETLRAGVRVVSAPQLFPTPAAVARRVVDLAEIGPDMTVLEPSAGTGALLKAVGDGPDKTAVEINGELVRRLASGGAGSGCRIVQGDFLAMNGELGQFDRIVMNPPFANGDDVRHVRHALGHLKPGGRLVSVVAAGPRQRAALEPIATEWIDLPAGSFAESGTNVNAAIVVIDQ